MPFPFPEILSPTPALAFGVALSVSAAARLLGGKGGERLAGAGIPAGALAAWVWTLGVNTPPEDVFAMTSHIAFAGVIVGTALDVVRLRRWFRRLCALVFAAACVWITLGKPISPPHDPVLQVELSIGGTLLCGVWALALWRLERHGEPDRGAEGAMALTSIALGLAVLAKVAEAAVATAPAIGLAAACVGFAAVAWPMKTPFSMSAVLGGGGMALGLAQGLGSIWSTSVAPLSILLLSLFAGPTARRMPWAGPLRPLWSLALSALPAVLAVLAALALKAR